MKPAALLSALIITLASAQSMRDFNWVATWAASQQVPEPQNALPIDDMRDMTMREIVHVSIGGTSLRVHVSNAFGTEPLHFTSVHIARPVSAASSQIEPGSDRALTFAGSADVTV